ncbi:DUF4918 family protein [Clostridium sp. MCC353]|uniref:uracil-DNA glycosylase family protein n=1 Tax=Clostridium sp. MCC353 TaxID=2592646 RepID=UPI001C010738|nr:uracil-DNA glycosylase family protein [Clostridium sp. MCC353]MBT9776361.1 DUF4918 family protein [Clostridium sp. MCC353]
MNKKMTFAEQIMRFNSKLSDESFDLPAGVKVMNPYNGAQKDQVIKAASAFYQKYYNDTNPRRMILGSTPARRGSSATGVPFVEAGHLFNETGIYIDKFYINQPSSGFIYDVIREYGGFRKFYTDFYMNFVCPLGLSRINSNGSEVNCNYYEIHRLQEILKPFIIRSIRSQIEFGIDTSVCYCIGSGKNFDFLTKINAEHKFFDNIIPLEHPRFIMQYNSKQKDQFIEKYIKALCI